LIQGVFIFIFGKVSSEAGRPLIALTYALWSWGVLGLMSTSFFAVILWLGRGSFPRLRWAVACGVVLGCAAGIMAGLGLTPSLGRVLFPARGRIYWFVVSALPGIIVGLATVTAVAVGRRIAGRHDEAARAAGN
jgi:hypothetical protein